MNINHKIISLAILCAMAQIPIACNTYNPQKNGSETVDTPMVCPYQKPSAEDKTCPCQKPSTENKDCPRQKPSTENKDCPCQKPQAENKNCPCQKPPTEQKVTAEIAIGELADKITILEIKLENIIDETKLQNIEIELASLQETYASHIEQTPELIALKARLLAINKQLWDIEDAIRAKERKKEFDSEFIELARSVYFTNDERCAVKRSINNLTGSRLVEEKSYSKYV